jgi:hypothetical protein
LMSGKDNRLAIEFEAIFTSPETFAFFIGACCCEERPVLDIPELLDDDIDEDDVEGVEDDGRDSMTDGACAKCPIIIDRESRSTRRCGITFVYCDDGSIGAPCGCADWGYS